MRGLEGQHSYSVIFDGQKAGKKSICEKDASGEEDEEQEEMSSYS